MIDLADFLLARIAEDEAVARESGADAMVGWRWKHYPPEAYEEVQALTLAHSARVLAECDAKRRIVERYQQTQTSEFVADAGYQVAGGAVQAFRVVMRDLALPYADHPDYREEWRL